MATINASGVISSAAVGSNFDDTINLTNASTSDSGIGTFWYAWVPGEDFLATSPISVSPPAGWTDNITNMGPGDGFAIQFLANGPANDVQPGRSLSFSFTSADAPASVNGNSVFFPGTPVNTSFVYPAGPFSDAGHQFVVTPASPGGTAPPAASTPPVTVVGVQDVTNKKHAVTEIVVDLSGPVNAAQADRIAAYQLRAANAKGSFTAKNSPMRKLRSAVFDPANDTVTLTLRKAFALTTPVELTIDGTSPSGLQDSSGQLIDGNADGVAGGNAVVRITRGGVTLNSVARTPATVSRPASATVSHAAPRGGSSVPSPVPPVGIGTTPPVPPVGIGTTPPVPPVGIPPNPYPFL